MLRFRPLILSLGGILHENSPAPPFETRRWTPDPALFGKVNRVYQPIRASILSLSPTLNVEPRTCEPLLKKATFFNVTY